MLSHHHAAYALIVLGLVALPACGGVRLNPVHEGKFTFEGMVRDENGKPVPNAWVKVRGWETLSDAKGHWRQEQVVNCGALHDHPGSYDENDDVLIEAPGFVMAEEHFLVKHPAFFQSCEPEQKIVFDTVLQPVPPASHYAGQTPHARQAPPRPEQKSTPLPPPSEDETPAAPETRNNNTRGYSL